MYHLAIDIGASSGRHILGHIENGVLVLEEIYRFENGVHEENGTLVWDIEALTESVITGIGECAKLGKIPATIAIDTWAVDYVLLDGQDQPILPVVAYRDTRTVGIPEQIEEIIPQTELYRRTGIQKMNINSIYQLYCDKQSGKLENAAHFLMIPDYLSYCLTGVRKNEYTNASTTNLVNADTKTWDEELLQKLGISRKLFEEPSLPGTVVGALKAEIEKRVGFSATVILCPSHDTASAVAACPLEDGDAYLSSGTWSLIGRESTLPIRNDAAREANFTNEGGLEYRYRFLKNIAGMWLLQNVKKDLKKQGFNYTYDELMNLAAAAPSYEEFDPNEDALTAPDNMIEAIEKVIGKGKLPTDVLLSSIYHSLAKAYADAIRQIEAACGTSVKALHIVGGGAKNTYLNELAKAYTGKRIFIGLSEATATGNLLSQLLYTDPALTLSSARALVRKSFSIQEV